MMRPLMEMNFSATMQIDESEIRLLAKLCSYCTDDIVLALKKVMGDEFDVRTYQKLAEHWRSETGACIQRFDAARAAFNKPGSKGHMNLPLRHYQRMQICERHGFQFDTDELRCLDLPTLAGIFRGDGSLHMKREAYRFWLSTCDLDRCRLFADYLNSHSWGQEDDSRPAQAELDRYLREAVAAGEAGQVGEKQLLDSLASTDPVNATIFDVLRQVSSTPSDLIEHTVSCSKEITTALGHLKTHPPALKLLLSGLWQTAVIHQAHKRGLEPLMPVASWLAEHCTVTLKLPRQSGITTAAIDMAFRIPPGEQCLYLAPLPEMVHRARRLRDKMLGYNTLLDNPSTERPIMATVESVDRWLDPASNIDVHSFPLVVLDGWGGWENDKWPAIDATLAKLYETTRKGQSFTILKLG